MRNKKSKWVKIKSFIIKVSSEVDLTFSGAILATGAGWGVGEFASLRCVEKAVRLHALEGRALLNLWEDDVFLFLEVKHTGVLVSISETVLQNC